MILNTLQKEGLITPPKWLVDNTMYLTIMGSQAYGVANNGSDIDMYGFAVPPIWDVFPHLNGEILGFGLQKQRFNQWQEHHISHNRREYDFSVYSIVRYFQLAMENNPNMVDSLFTPVNCVVHVTQVGQMVRDARKIFLHKGSYHKFRGYAYSQVAKMDRKETTGKRRNLIDTYSYDVKFAYHIVRLMDEAEQILETGDIDLQRSKEVLRAIRAGEWPKEKVLDYFNSKERYLQDVYERSTLRYGPDERAIKQLLLQCLEHHYGSLTNIVGSLDEERALLRKIANLTKEYA